MSAAAPRRVPEVDYLATSRRPRLADLPPGVLDTVGDLAGTAVARAHPPVGSGFGGGFAGLVDLADGSRVFVKAAGPGTPHLLGALAREAELLPHLARTRTASRLVGVGDVDDWRVLVLEPIDGTQPGSPWTDADADAAHEACAEVAALPRDVVDAMPLTGIRADFAGVAPAATATLRALADGGRDLPGGHVRVPRPAAVELAELSHSVLDVVEGDAVAHLDVRPDNLLRERDGRMRLVDWNQAVRGAPWVDLVTLWPLQHHHGVDVARFAISPLLAGVPDDAADALLAFLVGFMLDDLDAPPPPGCTEALRAHALFFSDTTVRLLAQRRGWATTG